MKTLPRNAKLVRSSPEFNESTIPDGLLKSHQTKEGVWGKIVVSEGRLEYSISESSEVVELDVSTEGVIEPTVLHHVKPVGTVKFRVEFYEA